ncbi:MAG TPA: gliding motility-associated C-terminal domain-containing protein, partial [Flavisolibacter sp.]|nr:gliding motility-associated C-terminal domain-containing protein [Flavisolibacter sp.]
VNPSSAGAGQHIIRYTFTANNGCSNAKTTKLVVFPAPVANAGADRFVLEGGSVQLLGSGSGNGVNFLWTPSQSLNNPAIPQPQAAPIEDFIYTLKVTSSDGCTAVDNVKVTILKALVIPNVFSPNGDGTNDRWEIRYLDTYPDATVEIFNRYGQPVFQSKGYSRPWDGTYKGNPLPAGTYYYIINPKNGRKQVAGYVDIIR